MKRDNRGFTLIEVMVAIALIGVIMLSLSGLLGYTFRKFSENRNFYAGTKLDGRYAMKVSLMKIRKNFGTTFENAAGYGVIKAADGTTKLLNTAPNPNPLDETAGELYFYSEPDKFGPGDDYGELHSSKGAVIAKNIKDIRLEETSPGLVKLTIRSGRSNNEDTFETTTFIRLKQ